MTTSTMNPMNASRKIAHSWARLSLWRPEMIAVTGVSLAVVSSLTIVFQSLGAVTAALVTMNGRHGAVREQMTVEYFLPLQFLFPLIGYVLSRWIPTARRLSRVALLMAFGIWLGALWAVDYGLR